VEFHNASAGGKMKKVVFLGWLMLVFFGAAAKGLDKINHPPLVSAKKNPVVSVALRHCMEAKPEVESIKAWVYFTDKELFDEESYLQAVKKREREFPQRALNRKGKVKDLAIDFYDLSVSQDYLDQVQRLGARLVHASRWLNAASFHLKPEQIDEIATLPFVRYVDIVRKYKVEPEPVTSEIGKSPEITPEPTEAHSLNYGSSFAQLDQLNVPTVHGLGYNGGNIIIGMFDTGFRKDHPAFATAYAEGRVLGEYDFIFEDGDTQNEAVQDPSYQHNHGTNTWSIAGGEDPGNIYGPAYRASFLLAKTEWVPAESLSEEDNWAAAAEWVDSVGGDIISSSLAYLSFDDGFSYSYADLNGDVAITTIAADMAAANGILVCNSASNSGPSAGSIHAPADADSIIAAGAVNSSGTIASFSSRGPTADGRIKPELVARGVSTYLAVASTLGYGSGSGTSYSCPLLAGCAALLWSARPYLTNMQIREAMIGSADRVTSPDNTYGYGLPDMLKALRYSFVPGDLNGDEKVTLGDVIFLVNFLFKSGSPEPVPVAAGDTNCDINISLADVLLLVNYILKHGPPACTPTS
jgi:subtilisin family serine protease